MLSPMAGSASGTAKMARGFAFVGEVSGKPTQMPISRPFRSGTTTREPTCRECSGSDSTA